MKRAGISAAMLVATSAVAIGAAQADDSRVTKTFDFTGFDRIEITGVYELDVRVGADYSVELTGKDFEMERVEVILDDGTLEFGMKKKKRKWGRNRDGISAVVTMPSLRALEVSGVVDGVVSGIDAEEFEVKISGVGDIELDGECGTLDARLSGVGDLDAKDLECNKVEVRVSGVGDANVYARDEVDARVSGMGSIDVYGSPKTVSKSNGMFADISIH